MNSQYIYTYTHLKWPWNIYSASVITTHPPTPSFASPLPPPPSWIFDHKAAHHLFIRPSVCFESLECVYYIYIFIFCPCLSASTNFHRKAGKVLLLPPPPPFRVFLLPKNTFRGFPRNPAWHAPGRRFSKVLCRNELMYILLLFCSRFS